MLAALVVGGPLFFALASSLGSAAAVPKTIPLDSLATEQLSQSESPAAWLQSWGSDPEPLYAGEDIPKVSPAVFCVMCFCFLYFILHAAFAIARTIHTFSGKGLGVKTVLEHGCTAVSYAPMLCALFIAARMRAIQLAQGETLKYGLPQSWVQFCMLSTLASVFLQVCIVLIIPVFVPGSSVTTDADGNVDLSGIEAQAPGGVVKLLTALHFLLLFMLYGGFTLVIIGIFVMEAPKEIWGDEKLPVSPAVLNTVLLSTLYFAVYLGVMLVKSAIVHYPRSVERLSKLRDSFDLAKFTVNMAPMLCILFIGARVRALQIDPKHGNPQKWAQMCFYACTASLAVQTLLVLVMPFLMKDCETIQGKCEGDVILKTDSPAGELFFGLVRHTALVVLYGGFTLVMISVFTLEHETKFTPPITASMTCVMTLTALYFTVYLGLFICVTIKEMSEVPSQRIETLIAAFGVGQHTVKAAPMLSMLFMGARLRSNQLTLTVDHTVPPGAGPQYWAQDAMFLATWAVTLQLLASMAVPVFTGVPEQVEDGMMKASSGTNRYVAWFFEFLNYTCLVAMYGGAVIVNIAVFTMTPETLPPYARPSNLIPGVEVPKPPLPETPNF